MSLEFTTTAMMRPEIIRRTYESFRKNLIGVDWDTARLYINVDPMPAGADRSEIESACLAAFAPDNIVYNFRDECSFPAAVKWCFEQPRGEWFFHLEDDWILTRVMDVGELVAFMQADEKLSVTNLRYYPSTRSEVCLAPGLWRTEHARRIAAGLCMCHNPEVQLRRKFTDNPHGDLHLRTNTLGKQFPGYRVLEEIGRDWLAKSELRKECRYFTRWVDKATAGAMI